VLELSDPLVGQDDIAANLFVFEFDHYFEDV
jgi:hypothetical protein